MNTDKTIAVLVAHGGVGDFLFQLDLAKRLELSGIRTLFLVRKNRLFLSQILQASTVTQARIIRADGVLYAIALVRVWALMLVRKIIIINSFHYTALRLPTKIFYKGALFLQARLIVCQRTFEANLPYEQVPYKETELIWQRNNRIVTYLVGETQVEKFPVLTFTWKQPTLQGRYIHIHPVASSLAKSYPPHKLIEALEGLGDTHSILLTMTPHAERWYMTDELHDCIAKHRNITFISRQFLFADICGLIAGAMVFCTVNTGLLWLALMLSKKVVVCDTPTEYEWNPLPYGATRLPEPEGGEVATAILTHY